MIGKPAKTPIISFNNNTPLVEFNSLKLRILGKSEHISPKLVNNIFLTPGRSGLERHKPKENSVLPTEPW